MKLLVKKCPILRPKSAHNPRFILKNFKIKFLLKLMIFNQILKINFWATRIKQTKFLNPNKNNKKN